MNSIYSFELSTDGVGIVLYSNKAMEHVAEGEDFFEEEFSTPEKVSYHIRKGDITGFCTGSSGEYIIKIFEGYPDEAFGEEYPISIRLALDVKGDKISIIDLYWLMDWSDDVPEEQSITVEEGIYHITVLTKEPESGIWGDDQEICIFLNKIDQMPELTWDGVPYLFTD